MCAEVIENAIKEFALDRNLPTYCVLLLSHKNMTHSQTFSFLLSLQQ